MSWFVILTSLGAAVFAGVTIVHQSLMVRALKTARIVGPEIDAQPAATEEKEARSKRRGSKRRKAPPDDQNQDIPEVSVFATEMGSPYGKTAEAAVPAPDFDDGNNAARYLITSIDPSMGMVRVSRQVEGRTEAAAQWVATEPVKRRQHDPSIATPPTETMATKPSTISKR